MEKAERTEQMSVIGYVIVAEKDPYCTRFFTGCNFGSQNRAEAVRFSTIKKATDVLRAIFTLQDYMDWMPSHESGNFRLYVAAEIPTRAGNVGLFDTQSETIHWLTVPEPEKFNGPTRGEAQQMGITAL